MPSRIALAALSLLLAAAPAFAHHPMGGAVPETFMHGLLSGIGHPVIGIDHFAFVVAVGLAAAFMRNVWAPPLAAIAGMTAGCLLTVGALALPMVEPVVALSVLLLGGMVLFGRGLPAPAAALLFAFAGLFHGAAYGEAVIGAEPTPVVAYLVGLAAVQMAIALASAALVQRRVEGGLGCGLATAACGRGLRRHRPRLHRRGAGGRAARLNAPDRRITGAFASASSRRAAPRGLRPSPGRSSRTGA